MVFLYFLSAAFADLRHHPCQSAVSPYKEGGPDLYGPASMKKKKLKTNIYVKKRLLYLSINIPGNCDGTVCIC